MTIDLILLIITIIVLIKNHELSNNVKSLREQLNRIPNFCDKCGKRIKGVFTPTYSTPKTYYQPVQTPQPVVNPQPVINQQPVYNVQPVQPVQPKYTDTEIKNSLILIVGSCLLVLAAILFLTTTWTTTSNYLKTFILVMMLVLFIGASYIADKVLKIKQTAKAFYYLALAYLPIVLVSIYLFELLGEFFSASGAGKHIYLALSSLIVTIVYFISSIKRTEKVTCFLSLIFSILTLLYITQQFTTNYLYLITVLISYSLILNILYSKNIYYSNQNIHFIFLIIMTILLTISNIFPSKEIIHYINLLLQFINIYYLLNITNKLNKVYEIVYPIYIPFFLLEVSYYIGDKFSYNQGFLLISFLIIYCYDFIKDKKVLLSSNIIVNILFMLLIQESLVFHEESLPFYILFMFISFINYIYYFSTKEKYSSYIASVSLLLGIEALFFKYEISVVYLESLFLTMYLLSKYLIKNELFKKTYTIPTTVFFILNTLPLFIDDKLFLTPIVLGIFSLINIIEFYINKKEYHKIFSYIYINIFIISVLHISDYLDFYKFAITISVINILTILIENTIPELKTKNSTIYITLNTIASYLILNIQEKVNIYLLSLLIITNIAYVIDIYLNRKNSNLTIIPFILSIPYLYLRDILPTDLIITPYISILIIIFYDFLIYKTKENRYIIYFFIYTILHMLYKEQSSYLNISLLASGTLITYYIKENKVKDYYKVLLSLEVLYFIRLVVKDLSLIDISVFRFGPYFIWCAFLTRYVFKKYIPDYKALEYLGFILLNIITIMNYTSEQDGTIFVIFLILLVLGAYTLKYGPIFLVSLIFILINILILTRDFWLNLPWWLYVLIAGLILIAFAVYNELKENKQVLKNLKDKLDL